jgi:hypothetical protein
LTRRILWQSRDFARSTFLYADKKLYLRDRKNMVALELGAGS